eukprot:gene10163-8067_t
MVNVCLSSVSHILAGLNVLLKDPQASEDCDLLMHSGAQGWAGVVGHGRSMIPRFFARHFSAGGAATGISKCFQHAITEPVAESLRRNGYAVVDNVFGAAASNALRDEVLQLYRGGHMHKNSTHLVSAGAEGAERKLLEKSHIHEAELTFDASIQEKAPLCTMVHNDHTMTIMLNLFTPNLHLDSQAIKLQVNSGTGGCFPIHSDSDETIDGRRVTSIFYLNPDWEPSHGGELRLYPWPGEVVDLAPLNDRLVLFSSTRCSHQVQENASASQYGSPKADRKWRGFLWPSRRLSSPDPEELGRDRGRSFE